MLNATLQLQRELLTEAVECLSDEGEIVYSTCSLEPEEDEFNMDWAIKNLNLQIEEIYCNGEKGLTNIFGKQLDPSIKRCKRLWPGETQGFFVCKLKKRRPNNMKHKAITNFAATIRMQIALNLDLMVEKNGRFYLVNRCFKTVGSDQISFLQEFFWGKPKRASSFPSFNLLGMLAKKEANRIVFDKKAAWLFICGRDILGKSIVRVQGPGKKDTNTLVLNEFGECLGFGRIVGKLTRYSQRSMKLQLETSWMLAIFCVESVNGGFFSYLTSETSVFELFFQRAKPI